MNQHIFKVFSTYILMTLLGFSMGIGALYAWQHLNRPNSIFEMETSAHFATTDKALILYSASWCNYCQKVKNYLHQHNVVFENRDIESSDPTIQQLFQSLDADGVPQILIGNKVIRGADLSAIEQELKKLQLI
ncbi:MAG: glutaredoxin family protein [Gammaproteobacteria bacterium]|jgi:glutaredoxin|nr:glutaredoxin family protein [Gammaproteobacteria bacterium]MBU2179562.1 glutaredoxin family protein [Gammaproteobacteria bacterium]MBU2223061.1 glutaredoxin family protein [Gammaproteobacteria bacterium]MBU2277854.1 glutaredoxin family protein [Gammaproteobacteria bacterium]MBU2428210.1 glutaredoxin family protein [Gammaproteobacteria bacterium]